MGSTLLIEILAQGPSHQNKDGAYLESFLSAWLFVVLVIAASLSKILFLFNKLF